MLDPILTIIKLTLFIARMWFVVVLLHGAPVGAGSAVELVMGSSSEAWAITERVGYVLLCEVVLDGLLKCRKLKYRDVFCLWIIAQLGGWGVFYSLLLYLFFTLLSQCVLDTASALTFEDSSRASYGTDRPLPCSSSSFFFGFLECVIQKYHKSQFRSNNARGTSND